MLTTLRRQTAAGLRVLIVMTLLCGVAYPLVIYGIAHIPGLSSNAEGSITGGQSSLVAVDPVAANPAADPYFHTRPSASSTDPLGPADTSTSGGSNQGGFSSKLLSAVEQRRALIAAREHVDPSVIPADAVTASGSGLDPDVSPEYAALQVPRVARVTGLPVPRVEALVEGATSGRILGFLGETRVNVTELNAAIHDARR